MFCSDKWIWTLANFFCTLSFLVQLFDLLPSYFAPTMTNTQISNEQLKNIDFPLDIQICVNPLLNTKALQEFGFSKVTFYQMGAFSNGTIGWGGLDNETGAMASAKEVLEVVRMNVTAAEVLKHVCIRTHESKGTENMVFQITLDRVNWLDECHVLNLTKVGKEKMQGLEEIVIFPDEKLLLEKNIWNTGTEFVENLGCSQRNNGT